MLSPRSSLIAGVVAITSILFAPSCVRPTPRVVGPNPQVDLARLWQDPGDLQSRDALNGPGGEALAPSSAIPYTFLAADKSGYSDGYDVMGPDGLKWSVKLGPEAQPEVVSSRVLWVLGYHQPPTYHLSSWTMTGEVTGIQPAGRFRPALPDRKVVGEWSWYKNEFIETSPFKTLVITNLLLNNWDWKTSNNKIYEIVEPAGGSRQLFVVQDLGASLGKTSFPSFLNFFPMRGLGQGTRNDLAGFESQRLLKRVDGDRPEFDYSGIHKTLLDTLTAADVVRACELMSRISDSQWDDIFRAAGYAPDERRRYVAKIKSKIAEGLSLADRLPKA